LDNSVNLHKGKFNTERHLTGSTEYAYYLINYKSKLEKLLKENKDWIEYPSNLLIEVILMEFDLFSLYLEREKVLESVESVNKYLDIKINLNFLIYL